MLSSIDAVVPLKNENGLAVPCIFHLLDNINLDSDHKHRADSDESF